MAVNVLQTKTVSFHGSASSIAGAFNSNTTPGSLLICILMAEAEYSSLPTITFSPPVTSGVAWVHAAATLTGTFALTPSGQAKEVIDIYYAADAAEILSAVQTSAAVAFSTVFEAHIDMVLYEVAGLGTTTPTSTNQGIGPSYPSATVPSAGSLNANDGDFIIAATNGGFPSGAAVGFTANGGDASVGNGVEWKAPGSTASYDTTWNAGAAWNWTALGVVFSGAPSTPILQVSPTNLNFSAVQNGSNPSSQNTVITNGDGGTLNWTTSSDQTWMSAAPSGTGNSTIAINISITGLAPGVYTGHLTVAAAGATGSPQTVTVTLTVLGSASGGSGGGVGGGGTISCIPSYANGVFVPDCSLYIEPATALYKTPIPSTRITAAESTLEGRKSIVIDFDSGQGLYARDFETTFTWPLSLGTVLHIWQPSLIEQPEGIYSRAEDWDNGGMAGAKFIQGIVLTANSFNAAKTFQLQSADDLSYHTLNECPATFNGQSEKAFSCTPFVAHSARIISSDGVEWQVFGSKLVFQPYPELTMNWETEKVSLGLTGWGHAREINLAYISTAQITLVLSFDFWPTITLTIPGSAGLQLKTKITLPSNKWKLIGFRAYSTAPFRIFEKDLECKVKQWGSTGPYVVVRPFGGSSNKGAIV